MLTMISPALNMKKEPIRLPDNWRQSRKPVFLEEARYLWQELKKYQPYELESLLGVNERIAFEAFMNYQDYEVDEKMGVPALLAFAGLVYMQLETEKMSKKQIDFAAEHLRILSGIYGALTPLDRIVPYRLEMGNKVRFEGQNLYKFWGDKLYSYLYQDERVVVNLASSEYSKCIRPYLRCEDMFIEVEFLVYRPGKQKNIVAWTKMARGRMARYIIENQIEDYHLLKEFTWDGYQFEKALSYEQKLVFIKRLF